MIDLFLLSLLFLQCISGQVLRAHIGKQPVFTYQPKDTSAVEGKAREKLQEMSS